MVEVVEAVVESDSKLREKLHATLGRKEKGLSPKHWFLKQASDYLKDGYKLELRPGVLSEGEYPLAGKAPRVKGEVISQRIDHLRYAKRANEQ